MKPVILCLTLLVMLSPLALAADPVIVPVTGEVTATASEAPQAALRRMSRSERKLAREVLRDAAEAAGMRRLEFMRAVNNGDVEANDELKMSLAASDVAREVDVERLREILQVILDFISQLLAIFSMFADASTLNAVDCWVVNVGFDVVMLAV